jgi:ADP-heptose:LPS heptosyltransferase
MVQVPNNGFQRRCDISGYKYHKIPTAHALHITGRNAHICGSMAWLSRKKKQEPERKILVIRFSAIGDIVLTSPIVRCLHRQMPGYAIHFLTKTPYAQLVQHHPHIEKVFAIDNDVEEVAAQLQAEGYAYVVDLHNNFRSRLTTNLLKNARVFRYQKPWFRRWLYVTLKLKVMPQDHVVDRYFAAIRPLGITNDNKGLEIHIPKEEEFPVDKLPFTHLAGYAVLVIGAAHFTKRLPLHQLEKLCRELPVPVILIGGKEDTSAGYLLEQIDPLKIYSTCGRLNLLQSASLISKAKWVISHDTGMMHIAAAFNRKIISIWGGTTPLMGFTPYLPQEGVSHIIEAKDVRCRPCHQHGRASCPMGHFNCMEQINTDQVADIIEGK